MIVYLLTNKANGKGYVGKTKRSFVQRWKEHVHNAMNGHVEMPLYAAIRKHGADAFEHKILQECDNEDELDLIERKWIADLNTFNVGYNATLGGDGLRGYKHTDEMKKWMSLMRTGKPMPAGFGERSSKRQIGVPKPEGYGDRRRGAKNPMAGKHHSKESRLKITQAQIKDVNQLSLSGEVIATYPSVIAASEITGVGKTGISRACRYSHRSAGGYKWQFLETKKGQ